MESNNYKKWLKQGIAFLLVLCITSSTFYTPIFAPKAEAFFVFTTDVKAMAREVADGFAMVAARKLIDSLVNSTIDWAQNGFDGNPVYVTDSKQYFTDIADGVAGEFIYNSKQLNFLCSPFQVQVRLALRNQYVGNGNRYQCTLSQVVGNIDAFYGDFNQGGWEAWFSMTQNPSNNPYGAYLEAKMDLDSRLANSLGIEQDKLNRNQGFLSVKKCTGSEIPNGFGGKTCLDTNGNQAPYKDVTPGVMIKDQLDKVLPAGVDRITNLVHAEQLIDAFASGALNRFVFGSKGFFSDDNSKPTPLAAGLNQGSVNQTDPCLAARELYGSNIDCNPANTGNPFAPTTSNTQQATTNTSSDSCASQEQINQFLENNPGDEGRLGSAFPC